MSHNVENPFANKEAQETQPEGVVSPEQIAGVVDFNEQNKVVVNGAETTGVTVGKASGSGEIVKSTEFVKEGANTYQLETDAGYYEGLAAAAKTAKTKENNAKADAEAAVAELNREPSPQEEAQNEFQTKQGEITANHEAQQAEINESLSNLDTRAQGSITDLFAGGLDAPERQPEYTNNGANVS